MELINQQAEVYARRFTGVHDKVLTEIAEHTMAHHPHAQMLSGQVQGKLLQLISSMIRPKRILEIGTFTGFSALCLAKGLAEDGVLHTIELRDDDALTARNNFIKAGFESKIHIHVGNALEIIPSLGETWDLVFIDADKLNYPNYYELILPMVRKGGWILADNVLFHGEVLKENITEKNALAIHSFNEMVAKDERVDQVLLTVRDGVMLIQKK